jgi:hypothetical protein
MVYRDERYSNPAGAWVVSTEGLEPEVLLVSHSGLGRDVQVASDVQLPSEAKTPENARDRDRARAGWAGRTSS